MEDGQKYNIPLNSGLDVHSSDMLVPVEKPKFQHNRQKFQGKYLPSSVRFEKDGWAAGNDVYQFNISEATVQAGSFIVSKSYLNNNPSYIININDSDGNSIGSVIYNNSNKIKSHTCDSCSISSDVNPKITGSINGKEFELNYDSVSGSVTKQSGNNITLVSTLKNDYSMEIKLNDLDANISLEFGGMSLPDDIYNGDYLLGSFMLCEGSLSKWVSGNISCYYNYDTKQFWITNGDSEIAGSRKTLTPDNNGNIKTSFNLQLIFVDNTNVNLVEFFPFFSNVTASAIGTVVQSQASSDKNFNKWSYSIEDPENTSPNTSDKLYRNLPAYNDDGSSDYNKQRIEQVIPVWFGISVEPGFTHNEPLPGDFCVLDGPGFDIVHGGFEVSDLADISVPDGTLDPQYITAKIFFRTTKTVKAYSREIGDKYFFVSLHRPNVHVWHHCKDVFAGTRNIPDSGILKRIKVILHYTYTTWKSRLDEETSKLHWYKEEIDDSITTYITDNYYFTNSDQLFECFSVYLGNNASKANIKLKYCEVPIFDPTNDDIFKTKIDPMGDDITKEYTFTSSWQVKETGAFTVEVSNTYASIKRIAKELKLKGQITSLGKNSEYLSPTDDIVPEKYRNRFFVRCCNAHVISDLYIKSESLLTSALSASAFQIEPVKGTDSDTLYVNDLFQHKVIQASCNGSLNIGVYLCAKESNTYIFYNSDTPSSDDKTIYRYCPGHIIFGSIKKATNSDIGLLSAYAINKKYDITNVDTNYSLSLTITGTPAKDENDNLFSYISSIESSFNNTGLIQGNKFTSELASNMQSALIWDCSAKPKFKVALNYSSSDDIGHVVIDGQVIKCIFENSEIPFKYNLHSSKLIGSGSFKYGDYTIGVSTDIVSDYDSDEESSKEIQNMVVKFSTSAFYDLNFHIPMLFSASVNNGWNLISLENNKAVLTITKDSKEYKCDVDFDTKEIIVYSRNVGGDSWGPAHDATEYWPDIDRNIFTLTSDDIRIITAVLIGTYNPINVKVTGLTASAIQMTVNGESISVDVSSRGLFNPNVKSKMDFLFTNVNDENLKETSIAELETEKEYQFLKQQWDTTNDTENFWWIDSSHILVLTKSEIIIRQKASNLPDYNDVLIDDWNGDVFVDKSVYKRSDYINSDILKYFCTSAYAGATAKFITVSLSGSNIIFNIYDPLKEMSVTVKTVSFKKQNLGDTLCLDNSKLYTYSDFVYENVISQARWSGTCIDDKIIIGLHYDNNFNQWAIIIDNTIKIIQGYGFVGVNGCLTGGEIPAKYFNIDKGFIGTVNSLDSLSDISKDISNLSELFTITDRIVGNDAQQWYISNSISSIVSHIEYVNGLFVARELALNNNYSANYDSASYCATTFSNYSFKVKNMKDIFPESNGAWTAMLVMFGWPLLYYLDPKISVANYLQQTLGQAAYVHYNSTSIQQQKDLTKESVTNNYSEEPEEHILTSDEISFDRQSVKQTQKNNDPYTSTFSMCAAALVSALDWGQEVLQVNKAQNQSAIKDIGRKYTSNFLQNLNSMAAADMNMQSVNPVQTSEVTAIKTLDMFYSTCDKQQVQAGPGYVNHNFVAQCVSQSVTSVQSEFSQQRLLYIIGALSEMQLQITNKALESAKNALKVQIDSFAGSGIVFGGFVVGGNTTLAASIALGIAWTALDIACNTTRIGLELIPKIVNSLGGNKLNSSIVYRQSKHNYDIEGKHKYGSKSECFMWPCFGVDTAQVISDESVAVVTQNKSWKLSMPNGSPVSQIDSSQPSFVTYSVSDNIKKNFDGQVPYYIAMIKGIQKNVTLPDKMAYVIGTESFLATSEFKNENIGVSEPVFPTAPFQDYIIDSSWNIGQTASVGMTTWISCKDTKVIDGELSNCVISDDFCGLASPYTAIEVKRGIQKKYLRPWAVTPQVLGINNTGLNCCFEEKAYHAFDGYGYRVVNWIGSAGMNKEHQTWLYSFIANDRFKRSNKMPQNEYLGNFKCDPVVAIYGDTNDKVYTLVTQPGEGEGLTAGTIGEDKDSRRYAIPVFSEFVNTLPAAVKTISAITLGVIDGITSLTTNNRDLQTAYKSPTSIDFTIGKNTYRFTQEYICSLQMSSGVSLVQELVPCLGLEFIGSTPYEAYLYSPATKQYYIFTGGSSLQMVDMIERFRDVVNGRYDFVNQEVIMPCIATFLRLDKNVLDDNDEVDNVIIPRLKNNDFIGEVWPPLETIYNTRSWFRTLSLPCGITYQGPNRCIINRFVFQDFMLKQVKDNYGKWKRVPRETYHPFRTYKAKYEQVNKQIDDDVKVKGWTHNPFLLVTAPIGTDEYKDNIFEWEITFCWPVEMDKLYAQNNYATVNIQAETMTPGGKVVAERPVHVYLTKELFTRTGNYGYYSFRYQSKCGAGNRERLHIWSDQYICISSLYVELKEVTQKRTEQLTQQVDIQSLKEI